MDKLDKTLIIRADADSNRGIGHIMRCIALAQEWQEKSGMVLFISCCTNKSLTKKIIQNKFELITIEKPWPDPFDLNKTIKAIKDYKASWLVTDGYHFTEEYHAKIKATGVKLLVIDDYNYLSFYNADILLNQNMEAQKYSYATSPGTIKITGNRFAMLKNNFLLTPESKNKTSHKAYKILVTLGGADPGNLTLKVINALKIQKPRNLAIKIVLGPENKNHVSVQQALLSMPFDYDLITDTFNMPDLITWADIAVSAGGSTTWELLYHGVPAIFIINADNQKNIVMAVHNAEAGINAGFSRAVDHKMIADKIDLLLQDSNLRQQLSINAKAIIDGKGRKRVVHLLRSMDEQSKFDITILSDKNSWINQYIPDMRLEFVKAGHNARLIHSPRDLNRGDVAFFLGCSSLIDQNMLKLNTHNLVVHGSDLPKGKGWSPLTWQILEGQNKIPVTLFEAEPSVDSGVIYSQQILEFSGHELILELREKLGKASINLCCQFIKNYPSMLSSALPQKGRASFYKKRSPKDSQMDINKTLAEQFNLMRVADNDNYPLFFEINNHKYRLFIEKQEK